MMHSARPRCLGYEDNTNCPNVPRKNHERCRPCDSIFRTRKAPANTQGIKPRSCTCGGPGRVYLDLHCPRCFITELALRLWKDDGCPEDDQPHMTTAKDTFNELQEMWNNSQKAAAQAQGAAVTVANQQQAFHRAQMLAQSVVPPSDQESKIIREIVNRCRNREAIITLSDGSSFTVQEDRFIGDDHDEPMTTVLAAHLRMAPMPVCIILRVFTGQVSTVPFPKNPSNMLPMKAVASCLYHDGGLIPLDAELTREAYEPQPDIEFEDW